MQGRDQPRRRRLAAGVSSPGRSAIGSQPILSCTNSVRAMSAAPIAPASRIKGRLPEPPPALSCRTRRETKLTRMFGLTIRSNACRNSSVFKVSRIRFPASTSRYKRPGKGRNRKNRETSCPSGVLESVERGLPARFHFAGTGRPTLPWRSSDFCIEAAPQPRGRGPDAPPPQLDPGGWASRRQYLGTGLRRGGGPSGFLAGPGVRSARPTVRSRTLGFARVRSRDSDCLGILRSDESLVSSTPTS
jgi:hypothetical protein